MNKTSRTVRELILLALLLQAQGCFPENPGIEENPSFIARSTSERTTNGIVFDGMTDPTPFSPYTGLEYFVADSASVVLLLTTVDKQPIDTIVNQAHGPGLYRAMYSGDFGGLGKGVYLWELHIGDYVEAKPFVSH